MARFKHTCWWCFAWARNGPKPLKRLPAALIRGAGKRGAPPHQPSTHVHIHTSRATEPMTLCVAACAGPQESLDSALFHFGQLLEHRPRHYEALAQLIALLRRCVRDSVLAAGTGRAPAASQPRFGL